MAAKVDNIVSGCPDSFEVEEGDIGVHTRIHAKSVRVGLAFLGEARTLLCYVLLQGPHSDPREAHTLKPLRDFLP